MLRRLRLAWGSLGCGAGGDLRLCLPRLTIDADPAADAAETAIRGWAATDSTASEVATRVDTQRIDYVIGLLVDVGMDRRQARRRAHLLYRILIGEYMWRSTGGPKSTKREVDEVADLILS